MKKYYTIKELKKAAAEYAPDMAEAAARDWMAKAAEEAAKSRAAVEAKKAVPRCEEPKTAEEFAAVAAAVAYATPRRIYAASNDPIIARLMQEERSGADMLRNGDISDNIPDGYELVQVAYLALMEEAAKSAKRGEVFHLQKEYEQKKLKTRVQIGGKNVQFKTEKTNAMREAARSIRRWIDANKSGRDISRYVYISHEAEESEAANMIYYERLPLYSDIGGYVRDYNGAETVYTAEEETAAALRNKISALKLSPRQFEILAYRQKGYGTKAIAAALGIKRESVKEQLKRIGAKAAALGMIYSGEEEREEEREAAPLKMTAAALYDKAAKLRAAAHDSRRAAHIWSEAAAEAVEAAEESEAAKKAAAKSRAASEAAKTAEAEAAKAAAEAVEAAKRERRAAEAEAVEAEREAEKRGIYAAITEAVKAAAAEYAAEEAEEAARSIRAYAERMTAAAAEAEAAERRRRFAERMTREAAAAPRMTAAAREAYNNALEAYYNGGEAAPLRAAYAAAVAAEEAEAEAVEAAEAAAPLLSLEIDSRAALRAKKAREKAVAAEAEAAALRAVAKAFNI